MPSIARKPAQNRSAATHSITTLPTGQKVPVPVSGLTFPGFAIIISAAELRSPPRIHPWPEAGPAPATPTAPLFAYSTLPDRRRRRTHRGHWLNSLLADIDGPDLFDHYADHNSNQKGGNLRVGRPDGFTQAKKPCADTGGSCNQSCR